MRSRTTRRGATRRNVGAIACLVVVASLLLSTPSSSAPGDPVPGTPDLPELPVPSTANYVTTLTQGTVVRRSKMYITIGPEAPMWAALYTYLWNTPLDNPTRNLQQCARGRPCVPNPFFQPACATDDIETQNRGQYFRSWIYPLSPRSGGGADVGLVAKIRVNLVAFGSIPAVATLTLRAPRADGRVIPFIADVWLTNKESCDPSFAAPTLTARVEGKVEISLSDLRVDGVPVDLGSSCRTVRPADIALYSDQANGGYFPGEGGYLGAFDGLHPGSVAPLDSPEYANHSSDLQGRSLAASTGVTVPPFTGCGVGGDDLSPLVTAMASGPNNPIRATQAVASPRGDQSKPIDLDDLTACEQGYCPLPAREIGDRPPLPEGDE